MTDGVLLAAVTYLFIRRVGLPQVRYISLIADYFPLFLILAIATYRRAHAVLLLKQTS